MVGLDLELNLHVTKFLSTQVYTFIPRSRSTYSCLRYQVRSAVLNSEGVPTNVPTPPE
jgi:hypothetical protein